MKIKVNKHNIEIDKQELINEKEANVSKCYFEFSEDYTDSMVKKALFTKDNKTYEMLINNNECDYPSEILENEGTCVLGVYAYTTENEFVRFNPTPQKFAIELGTLRASENSQPITPSEMEQYQQALQNGLNEVNKELEEVVQIGNEVAKQGEYATEQGNYAKSVGEQLEKDKENGLFKGEKGDKGDQGEQGIQGEKGEQGKPGKNGADGYTPIKGVDYFDGKDYVLTEADKEEIADNLNEENNNRIAENEKDIVDIETYLDTLTPKATANGELVHITDALNLPTFENKVDGNVEQFTTTGKSLFDFGGTYDSIFINSLTFENEVLTLISNGGSYKFVTKDITNLIKNNPGKILKFNEESYSTVETSLNPMVQLSIVYSDGTETLYRALRNYKTNKSDSYNIPSDVSNIERARFGIYVNNTATDLANTLTIVKPMMYFDNGDDTYEPFTNGASPNPDYQQPIKVIDGDLSVKVNGKNLYNKDTDTIGKVYSATGVLGDTPVWTTSDWIKINPSKGYYLSCKTTNSLNVLISEFDKDKNFIQRIASWNVQYIPNIKTKYVRISYKNDIGMYDMQLELGDKATDYEPYQEQIAPLDLKGNFVGAINDDIKDYLVTDKKKYWLVKNVGKVVLDGSEEYNAASRDTLFVLAKKIDNAKPPSMNYVKAQIICDYFKTKYYYDIDYTDENNLFYSQDGTLANVTCNGISLDINKILYLGTLLIDGVRTVGAFKTWLSNNNVEVYYQLAEPQIIELGKLPEPIKTFEGVNNIQLLANLDTEIEVKYALDVKKYYDNKLAEISAQII